MHFNNFFKSFMTHYVMVLPSAAQPYRRRLQLPQLLSQSPCHHLASKLKTADVSALPTYVLTINEIFRITDDGRMPECTSRSAQHTLLSNDPRLRTPGPILTFFCYLSQHSIAGSLSSHLKLNLSNPSFHCL